jgi:dsRNA-specific ribonuclease
MAERTGESYKEFNLFGIKPDVHVHTIKEKGFFGDKIVSQGKGYSKKEAKRNAHKNK